MNRIVAVALIGALALAPAACGDAGTPGPGVTGSASAASNACQGSGTVITPVSSVSLTGSPTYDKIKATGKVIIGVNADQPDVGYKDASGKRCGFDIEIARYLAAQLGMDGSMIEYKEVSSADREKELKSGGIHLHVGTYAITDERKAEVAFAGPYYIAEQDLLVREDDASITGQESLAGKKVCAVTGSSAIQVVRDEKLTDTANIVESATHSECVSQLLDGRIDAVTADDPILKGYAAQQPHKLKVVGRPFSTEKYGVGLPRNDKALRDFVNDAIQNSYDDGTWLMIYYGTLGRSGGSPATPPALERY